MERHDSSHYDRFLLKVYFRDPIVLVTEFSNLLLLGLQNLIFERFVCSVI